MRSKDFFRHAICHKFIQIYFYGKTKIGGLQYSFILTKDSMTTSTKGAEKKVANWNTITFEPIQQTFDQLIIWMDPLNMKSFQVY